ncbi:MAG: HAD family hydrolase [Thermoanaerobaculaceae bacterium]
MQDHGPLLILFDVDGTLIRTHGRAGRALAGAIGDVFGIVVPLDGYRLSGKTDPQIVVELMAMCGWARERVAPCLPELMDRYLSRLDRELPSECVSVLPGVREVLSFLGGREDVRLGLLTGNVEQGATLKLERAGLAHHFALGAYGSDEEDRNLLVPVARARAAARWGDSFEGHRTVVVGDAEADVRCARAGGARSVAVATGDTPTEALRRLAPDALLVSLADPAALPALLDGRLGLGTD